MLRNRDIVLAAMLFGLMAAVCCNDSAAAQEQSPSNADQAARKKVLDSEAWRKAMHGYNEWLSVQQIYTKPQVEKMKADLSAKVATMSASQLQDMLSDMEEKLKVLFSPEAEEARTWLAEYMTAHTKRSREEMRKKLPDIANMTSAQMQQEFTILDQEHRQRREATQQMLRQRTRQVNNFMAARRTNQRSEQQALDRAFYSGRSASTYNSPYHPRRYSTPSARSNFYVTPWGGVGRIGL